MEWHTSVPVPVQPSMHIVPMYGMGSHASARHIQAIASQIPAVMVQGDRNIDSIRLSVQSTPPTGLFPYENQLGVDHRVSPGTPSRISRNQRYQTVLIALLTKRTFTGGCNISEQSESTSDIIMKRMCMNHLCNIDGVTIPYQYNRITTSLLAVIEDLALK